MSAIRIVSEIPGPKSRELVARARGGHFARGRLPHATGERLRAGRDGNRRRWRAAAGGFAAY